MSAMRIPLVLALLLIPDIAAAQGAVQLGFAGRVAGLRVFTVDALVEQSEAAYRVELAYRTVGLVGALFSADLHSRVQGQFAQLRPLPQRFLNWGHWMGKPRQTLIDYPDGEPVVVTLVPPNETEREPVPPEMQAGTVDSLSAIAMLTRQFAATGRCDGSLRVFDGRRLSQITSRTGGEEVLEADRGSFFAGKAMRCDFEGRQLAGFWLDDDKEKATRPQNGTAWIARLSPAAPPVPVRMSFEVRLLGHATMYLMDVINQPASGQPASGGPAGGPPAPARR
jgi:hypothetical protein